MQIFVVLAFSSFERDSFAVWATSLERFDTGRQWERARHVGRQAPQAHIDGGRR